MCGIAGTIKFTSEPTAPNADTLRLLTVMQHRGPDETKVRSYERASIGACRLSIVDVTHGGQPVTASCHGPALVLALNGEIYNYRELRSRLPAGHRFLGDSDTEVLAHLFEEWGPACLTDVNGMFSFAVSDGRTTWLVRDRLGVKPLYYRVDEQGLAFASEARVLAGRIDGPQLESTYAEFETTIGLATPFPGVLEVPPGCYLELDMAAGRHRVVRYHELSTEVDTSLSEDEAVEQLRWLVTDAVRLRTDTDLPYGCYVSGGFDSSLVATLSEPEWLFSAVVTERDYMNEERYVRILRDAVPARYQEVRVKPADFRASFVDMVQALDFPTTNLSAFTQYALSSAVREQGLRIMLGGIGVDELLAGYTRHVAAAMPSELSAIARQYPEYRPLLAKLADPAASPARRYHQLISRGKTTPAGFDVVRSLMARHSSVLGGLARTDLAVSFPPLLRCDDRINMWFSIESRSPFLDYRLADFCLRLPDELKLRRAPDGTIITKHLLRKAFADHLPAEIANRTDKIGFPSPVTLWLQQDFRPALERARRVIADVPVLADRFAGSAVDGEFSRTSWQLLQWAAWCLLNVHGLAVADTGEELFGRARRLSAVAGGAR